MEDICNNISRDEIETLFNDEKDNIWNIICGIGATIFALITLNRLR